MAQRIPIVRKCFMCKIEGVKAFNNQTLTKAKSSLETRIRCNLPYSDVTLPTDENNESIGYCSNPCYKTFNKLNRAYTLQEKEYVSFIVFFITALRNYLLTTCKTS